mmetsp:Transcript_10076/g.22394  ORF Transcript_10076/g.22394 Transcript_10076/m.22394 type:complete len:122 (+) Transcript_10076:795-1160(+)
MMAHDVVARAAWWAYRALYHDIWHVHEKVSALDIVGSLAFLADPSIFSVCIGDLFHVLYLAMALLCEEAGVDTKLDFCPSTLQHQSWVIIYQKACIFDLSHTNKYVVWETCGARHGMLSYP